MLEFEVTQQDNAVLAFLADCTIETSGQRGAIAQLHLLYVKPEVLRADLSG
jgi:hypothetical protein